MPTPFQKRYEAMWHVAVKDGSSLEESISNLTQRDAEALAEQMVHFAIDAEIATAER